MKQRGRKSKEQLSAVVALPGIVPGERPKPPAGLTAEQANLWRQFVGRMPSDWFGPESFPLLAQVCRHVTIAEVIGAALAEIDPKSVDDDGAFRRLERLRNMHDKEGRAISSLMTKLRITPHSQYDQTKAFRATKNVIAGPRPWETT
jgi:hypothetical protein